MHGRFLFAHMTLDEMRLAVTTSGQSVDVDELTTWWERARTQLAVRDRSWDEPTSDPLPEGHDDYVSRLAALPQAALLGELAWEPRLVDLTRVVGFQRMLVEERVKLEPGLPEGDFGTLLKFTLQEPRKHRVLIQTPLGPGKHEYIAVSESPNLRVTADAQADTEQGRLLGFLIGHGLPWIQVAVWEGRQILRDGYHRGLALLRAGITHVPVALVKVTKPEELGLTSASFFPLQTLTSAQPPLLRDFLDDDLSRVLVMPDMLKAIRITAEELMIAAMPQYG